MTGTDRASRAKHALSTLEYMQEKAAKIKKGGEGWTNASSIEQVLLQQDLATVCLHAALKSGHCAR